MRPNLFLAILVAPKAELDMLHTRFSQQTRYLRVRNRPENTPKTTKNTQKTSKTPKKRKKTQKNRKKPKNQSGRNHIDRVQKFSKNPPKTPPKHPPDPKIDPPDPKIAQKKSLIFRLRSAPHSH